MRYPVVIDISDDETALGVTIPDMPGCFSAGDNLNEAIENAEEAALAWIEATLAAGGDVPAPSSLEAVSVDPDYVGWILATIDIDTLGSSHRH